MSGPSKRFALALIVYLAWLGALAGLAVQSSRPPVDAPAADPALPPAPTGAVAR